MTRSIGMKIDGPGPLVLPKDGDDIAVKFVGSASNDIDRKWLADEINRIILLRMAEAWERGWKAHVFYDPFKSNPYRR
jgi:hypothetical protein